MLDPKLQTALTRPFVQQQIKQRKQEWTDKRSNQRRTLYFDYVETAVVIGRLNQVFGHAWSFEVHESQSIGEKQILVLGALTASGITKTAFGGAPVGQGEENVINAYKSAVGDAIKLCAKQFGIGLHLWMKD